MAKFFGDRLIGSIGSLVVGVLIFLLSFVVIFNGEGRTDFSKVAEKAVNVSEVTAEQDFAYVTGVLETDVLIGDDEFLLDGDYAAFDRDVEIFSWVEKIERDENDVKYYAYETQWVDEAEDSNEFHERRGHDNYEKDIQNLNKTAGKGFVGDFEVDLDKVRLPSYKALSLNDENVYVEDSSQLSSEFIFVGYGELQNPEIGDMRVSYSVVPVGDKVTAFGRPDGNVLESHHGDDEKGLYRIFWGTNDDAMATLTGEYKALGWAYRIGGFIMMWIGLMLVFKPLTVAIELIPFVARLGKAAVGFVTFLLALILTAITSAVSMVLHNPVGIALIVIVIAGGVYFFMMSKQKAATKSGQGARTGASDAPGSDARKK